MTLGAGLEVWGKTKESKRGFLCLLKETTGTPDPSVQTASLEKRRNAVKKGLVVNPAGRGDAGGGLGSAPTFHERRGRGG